jgi:hypothetical protein
MVGRASPAVTGLGLMAPYVHFHPCAPLTIRHSHLNGVAMGIGKL